VLHIARVKKTFPAALKDMLYFLEAKLFRYLSSLFDRELVRIIIGLVASVMAIRLFFVGYTEYTSPFSEIPYSYDWDFDSRESTGW